MKPPERTPHSIKTVTPQLRLENSLWALSALNLWALVPGVCLAQGKPDLRPAATSAMALQFAPNSCQVRVNVYNHGQAPAPASQVQLSRQVAADGSVTTITAPVPAIAAKKPDGTPGFASSAWIPAVRFFANSTGVPFEITVDSNQEIFEGGGESNNQRAFLRHVSLAPANSINTIPAACVARPDLLVSDFQWDPETCALKLKIRNAGLAETAPPSVPQNFLVLIEGLIQESAGNTSWTQNIPHLARGEAFETLIQGYRADPQSQVTKVFADSTDLLTESQETNNRHETAIPSQCYLASVEKCDFFVTSYIPPYSSSTYPAGINRIEKFTHALGTDTFEPADYWFGSTGRAIYDLAARTGNSLSPDDVRATLFGRHEKVNFLNNQQFEFDPLRSRPIVGGWAHDAGHLLLSPESGLPETQWIFSNNREIRQAPLSAPENSSWVASIPLLINGGSSDKHDQITDVTSLESVLFIAFHRRQGDETLLIKLSGSTPEVVGVMKNPNGPGGTTNERISGLATAGNLLYGINEKRSIFRIDPQTALLEKVTQLPAQPPGDPALSLGKTLGLTAKCPQAVAP